MFAVDSSGNKPGFGALSLGQERSVGLGLVKIGPSSQALTGMGDKFCLFQALIEGLGHPLPV